MSEVSDALQIIVVTGQAGYRLLGITVKGALEFIKVLHTLYLSKWKGKAKLSRLRQIKGEDLFFVNVASEDKSDLRAVEKEMKAHGVLYARMPDLCGGDGRTQYAIAACDVQPMKAMLLDHMVGANKGIRVGMISEKDYLESGRDLSGNLTEEARESIGLADHQPEQTTETIASRERTNQRGQRDTTETFSSQGMGQTDMSHAPSNPALRIHDMDLEHPDMEGKYMYIDEDPVLKTKDFSVFMMRDGQHVLTVPSPGIMKTSEKQPHRAVLFADQEYKMYDLTAYTLANISGKKALEQMSMPSASMIHERLLSEDRIRKMMKGMSGKELVREINMLI